MAVASLVLGIIALIGGLTGWAGVVCGILAIVFGGLIIALLIGGAIFGAVAAAL